MYNQYHIATINLDPTIGHEIKKTRPCVILSPNEMNVHLQTIIVAPLTSNKKAYPTRVMIQSENRKSMCALDQIRTIDKRRIIKGAGPIQTKEIIQIKATLKEMLVD